MHFKEAKAILSAHNGMNLYRGCSHGCIYCDSRSKCYGFEHDFEDIEVKSNAPALLESALQKKRAKRVISTGSMCDPYMHIEAELKLTRRCLEIIEQYGFGLAVQTKSDLILRDLDLLKSINEKSKCVVQMTLTTYDEKLCRIVEPYVCPTKRRFEVLKVLRDNGIPAVVWLSPILPFINDTKENLQGILEYCAEAGVYGILCFGMGMTLRDGNRDYYYGKLDDHFPGLKSKYRQKFGNSYECASDNSCKLTKIFTTFCKKEGIQCQTDALFTYMRTLEENTAEQLTLF